MSVKKIFYRIIDSTLFSIIFLVIVIGALSIVAYQLTEQVKPKTDFGAIVTIRQTTGNGIRPTDITLTRSMIIDYITDEKVLAPIAKEYNWDIPREEMLKNIDVREHLAGRKNFTIMINTYDTIRSAAISRALSQGFLNNYKDLWIKESDKRLSKSNDIISKYKDEIDDLLILKERYQSKNGLKLLNTEIEMKALNEQLLAAQSQFLEAYGAYISNMEQKRADLQLELDLLRQSYSDDNVNVINMKNKLNEITRQCKSIKKNMETQKPNIYKINIDPPKLTGFPDDIIYFYDNIQTLQEIKLSLLLDSIIEEKRGMIEKEHKLREVIERLRNSNSCDIFIKEVRI